MSEMNTDDIEERGFVDEENSLSWSTPQNESTEENSQTLISQKKSAFWEMMGGAFLEQSWVTKNKRLFFVILLMSIVNIANGYKAIDEQREIGWLEDQVRDYRYRDLFKASEVTAISQKLNVEKAIEEQDLNLELSQTPPYILYRSSDNKEHKKE